MRRPSVTVEEILALADEWYRKTGQWPHERDTSDWRSINDALHYGTRGLPGGTTLAQLLFEHRGVHHRLRLSRLSVRRIITWAKAHHRRTGSWPNARSGTVPEAPTETWRKINDALLSGRRGLPRGLSLAELLAAELGIRTRAVIPRLTIEQILTWADAHHERTGRWPTVKTGPIHEAPDETWRAVAIALQHGYRGLPGDDTLYRLLRRRRQIPRSPTGHI